ncbi:hypothetical protein Q5P01_011770 [Channa striata]|uniref:Cystein proteinase inhibitor protein salarin n=1 Tax=Channa striata TaxID=64152 RepID=A0AA88SPK0_CHASR|nr:hypothetical protein Q5P01_011770 [Channa striata]
MSSSSLLCNALMVPARPQCDGGFVRRLDLGVTTGVRASKRPEGITEEHDSDGFHKVFHVWIRGVCVLMMESSDSDKLDKANLDAEWEQWKIKFNKTYKNAEEESYRRGIWEDTMRFIEAHNKEEAEGEHSFTVGMNQFGDMKPEEICCGGLKQKRCCDSSGEPGQTHK